MGLDSTLESEGHDREAHPCNGVNASVFGLPGCQYVLASVAVLCDAGA